MLQTPMNVVALPAVETLRRWTRAEYATASSSSASRKMSGTPPRSPASSPPCAALPDLTGIRSRPLLVVEVADTSYRFDREFKASLYPRAAVPEYWIVDVGRGVVEVHRQPERREAARYGWRYASVKTLRAPSRINPLLAPATMIAVADLRP